MLAVLAAAGPAAAADSIRAAEYQVKAAFVCKFGDYVEWPAGARSASDPYRVGVLGPESIVEEVRRATASTVVWGRPVEILGPVRGSFSEGLHALFIARGTSTQAAAAAITAARGQPVLTITELEQEGETGMINFVVVDDKVRFDIALPLVVYSGLKISSRLLGVARRVEGKI